MAMSEPGHTPILPNGVGYIFQTGAQGADKTPFQQLVTMDAPTNGNVIAACNGRQGAYFMSMVADPFLGKQAQIHVLPQPGGTTDIPYDRAPKAEYVWRSKKYMMPAITTWSCAKVVHKCGCVRLRLYIDGCVAYDSVVRGSKPFTLPSQLAGTTLEIELIGTAEVEDVQVASSMRELASG